MNTLIINLKYLPFLLALLLGSVLTYSQDIIDDISAPIEGYGHSELFTENIQIIGASRKIFIITNSNDMMSKGDFITMVLDFKYPVARAVVAKNHDGLVGIKVLKIYSLKAWSRLRQGLDIQILKGDDSHLFKPQKDESEEVEVENSRIQSEEDLFNDKDFLSDEFDQFSNENRHIKPDNLVNVFWARYTYDDIINNETGVANELGGGWAYQFHDNLWVEGIYGRIMINDLPAKSEQTLVTNFVVRLKYTVKLPLYSYALPYVGYQNYMVSAPGAANSIEEQQAKELAKRNIVLGATVLRRLVPGWFLKADLGLDHLNIGFAIEF